MACSSNCNNVVLKSEQILLEQWQLIQGCDINNYYMQYYIYSVSRVHRGYPSRPPLASSERTNQLCVRTSASCTKPAHSHALSATAVLLFVLPILAHDAGRRLSAAGNCRRALEPLSGDWEKSRCREKKKTFGTTGSAVKKKKKKKKNSLLEARYLRLPGPDFTSAIWNKMRC
ncbi:Hypothetical_protein [Hexamita inflata]|uniref:Hypothetical_protein n=1 Tax=Hexamita inflata TaxID=28002 RepID=A0AA86V2P2_9EUKA|nr:Hypothetical protein HINF_LOCUS65969 [Hexamita inflata]